MSTPKRILSPEFLVRQLSVKFSRTSSICLAWDMLTFGACCRHWKPKDWAHIYQPKYLGWWYLGMMNRYTWSKEKNVNSESERVEWSSQGEISLGERMLEWAWQWGDRWYSVSSFCALWAAEKERGRIRKNIKFFHLYFRRNLSFLCHTKPSVFLWGRINDSSNCNAMLK